MNSGLAASRCLSTKRIGKVARFEGDNLPTIAAFRSTRTKPSVRSLSEGKQPQKPCHSVTGHKSTHGLHGVARQGCHDVSMDNYKGRHQVGIDCCERNSGIALGLVIAVRHCTFRSQVKT